MRMGLRRSWWLLRGWGVAAAGSALAFLGVVDARAQVVAAGAGSYYGSTPAGNEVPSDVNGAPVSPRIAPSYVGPPQTNKWWSSMIWQRYPDNAYTLPMHAQPLSMRATATGLDVAQIAATNILPGDYYYEFNDQTRGLSVGVSGMTAGTLRVAEAGDWHVTGQWTQGAQSFKATFGRGMPYVYCQVAGGSARVAFNTIPGTPTVWSNSGATIGVTIAGRPYGLFAPAGSTWTIAGNVATSTLNGRDYFTVAALPEATPAALTYFQERAFVFVTGTRASWRYDAPTSTVNATFDFDTTVKEGTRTTPLVALYRHQWLNTSLPLTAYTYPSARGTMKLAEAGSFTVAMPYRGLINKLPSVGTVLADNGVPALLNNEYLVPSLQGANDTYGAGRNYGKICQLIHLADVLNNAPAKDRFLSFVKSELREWLTIGPVGGGRSAFEAIQAESFNASSGVTVAPAPAPLPAGQIVTGVTGGTWLKYSGVDFANVVPNRLLVQYASTSGGSGLLEVRVDSLTGPVIAGGGVGGTGGAWQEIALGMASGSAGLSGVRDVYISVSTPYSGELFRFDSFRFDRAGAPPDRYFAYNQTWKTLIGYPTSYGSGAELNDHHFHWGYFIYAAATVAQYDAAWAAQYGPMIELLIRDAANWDRADTRFPYLRNFDPYAGHSYASGHAGFYSGNNQESSSEAMNFANGVALWGATTGNAQIRDLGLYLYASEAAAIQQYWFDADNAVYPPTAPRRTAGIVWDSGAAYATFFSAEAEHISGINYLPITPGTLYLGWRPDAVLKSYNEMLTVNGGQPTLWQSVLWSALALADPVTANARLTANPGYVPDGSDTKAQMVQFIRTLGAVGTIDTSVTADTPFYAVFIKGGVRTYWAWNPGSTPLSVRFSTGLSLCVPAGQTVTATAGSTCCRADFDRNGVRTVDDIFVYLAAWFVRPADPRCDYTGDGLVTIDDLFVFLAVWFAGCP